MPRSWDGAALARLFAWCGLECSLIRYCKTTKDPLVRPSCSRACSLEACGPAFLGAGPPSFCKMHTHPLSSYRCLQYGGPSHETKILTVRKQTRVDAALYNDRPASPPLSLSSVLHVHVSKSHIHTAYSFCSSAFIPIALFISLPSNPSAYSLTSPHSSSIHIQRLLVLSSFSFFICHLLLANCRLLFRFTTRYDRNLYAS